MASETATTTRPSRRLQRAAAAELTRLDKKRASKARRLGALHATVEQLQSELDALDRHINDLRRLSGDVDVEPAAGTLPNGVEALGGRDLRIRAVALRLAAHDFGPTHYRDWYQRFLAAGHLATGADPQATFLTNVTRHPLIEPGLTPGVYKLHHADREPYQARVRAARRALSEAAEHGDADAVERARRFLRAADRELREVDDTVRLVAQMNPSP
jgi:hypothetical protein